MDDHSSKHSTADSSSGLGSEAELDDRTIVLRIPKRHRGRMSAYTRVPGYKYIIKYVDDPPPPEPPRVKTPKELKAERIAAREKRKVQEEERKLEQAKRKEEEEKRRQEKEEKKKKNDQEEV